SARRPQEPVSAPQYAVARYRLSTMKLVALAVLGLFAAGAAFAADGELADLIQAGDRRAALDLIEAGADVNAPQGDGTTPLHWAVYRIDTALVETLLAHGALPDAVNL